LGFYGIKTIDFVLKKNSKNKYLKEQGLRCKRIFEITLWNYFLIGKGIDQAHGVVDRVHTAGARVHDALLKLEPFNL
jgi:hypothetical protein